MRFESGSITLGASILGAESGQVVLRFEVRDTGIGISAEQQALIFQPFVTTKATSGGTGLGLAICRQLIEPAGGRIEVDAQAAWTTFRVHLPVVSVQQ